MIHLLWIWIYPLPFISAFSSIPTTSQPRHWISSTLLTAVSRYSPNSHSSSFRSKRQERIGQVLRTELSTIFHSCPHEIKTYGESRDDDLLQRISLVRVDVSPDLRQAKVILSVYKTTTTESSFSTVMDRRRAYSFVVQYNKQIRHALSQRLRHWKVLPELSFEQADVGAAVDVMMLLDTLAKDKEFKRAKVGKFGGDDDSMPLFMEDEEEEDDLEWLDPEQEEEEESEEEEEEEARMPIMNNIEDEDDEYEENDDEDEELVTRRTNSKKNQGKKKRPRKQLRIEDL